MCEVSDKIRFCTCDPEQVDLEANHWIFKTSRAYANGMTVIGSYMLPVIGDDSMLQSNEEIIAQRVNDPDAFDVDLQPRDGDRLLVVVVCREHFDDKQHLEFEYDNGRWEHQVYYPFAWGEPLESSKTGIVK